MKRNSRIILCLVSLVAFVLLQGAPTQAMVVLGGSIGLTCTNFHGNLKYNANRNNTGTGAEHYAYLVYDGSGTLIGEQEFTDNFNSQDNFTKPFSALPRWNPIHAKFVSFAGNGLPEITTYTNTYDCPGLPNFAAVTWCDLRTDGRAVGDCWNRVAVYCNITATPPSLDVWGTGNNSVGFRLTTFNFKDLVTAGPKGMTKNLGALGTVSAMVDAQNNFWVAWNGKVTLPTGSFYADGQPNHGYAQGFTCNFKR